MQVIVYHEELILMKMTYDVTQEDMSNYNVLVFTEILMPSSGVLVYLRLHF